MIPARMLPRELRTWGFIQIRVAGSHRIWRHPDGRQVVVPTARLSDTFPHGTLRSILKMATAPGGTGQTKGRQTRERLVPQDEEK